MTKTPVFLFHTNIALASIKLSSGFDGHNFHSSCFSRP